MHLRKPGAWVFKGACAQPGVDPEIFYPVKQVMVQRAKSDDPHDLVPDEVDDYSEAAVAPAKALCAGCPVLATCRDWALAEEPEHGVWGALTPPDRRKEVLRRAITS